MFKKGLINFFILFLIFSSCDTTKESEKQTSGRSAPEKSKKDKIESVTYIQWQEKVEDCRNEECARIEVNYPSFSENRMNQRLESLVKSQIGNFIRDEKNLNTVKDYASKFIADFSDFKEEFPETNTAWYLDINVASLYSTNQWVCFKIETDSYTGGAHPNKEVSIEILDKNGRDINPKIFIKDQEALGAVAEKEFRDQKNISSTTNWEDTEYFFDDNQFQLPDNIGFTEKGMILYYNSYEINSYAEGPTEIILPFREINNFIELSD